ncbi:MAG TPA: adenylate kinase [Candidatus Sulfotelmatobacter sp.]|nr:adenylate kinase [Candidatus Sulfotelmatobacter sp.]
MILVFLGPPGSGKGTQAKTLAEKLRVPHISLGDILREEVRQGTEFGRRAKELMEAGKLVPDELTIALTRKRIAAADCRPGFILDGFPRSAVQAAAFDMMLLELKRELGAVIYFSVSEEEVVKRLLLRAKIEGRADDNDAAIRTRFEVYEKTTRPLIDHYKAAGKLAAIDAARGVDEVFSALLKIPAIAAAL